MVSAGSFASAKTNDFLTVMKTMPCPPKVIIHRLGCLPALRRRITPGAVVAVLLVLAAFAAGTVHSR